MSGALLALVIWAAHFTVLYAAHAVACERGVPGEVPTLALLATLLAWAALAAVAWRGGHDAFAARLARATAALAALAVGFAMAAVLLVPGC